MKKLLIALALLLPLAAQAASIQEIEAGWTKKVITNVPSGSLGVMLQRFQDTWPTTSVGEACRAIKTGYHNADPEAGRIVVNDTKNGFIKIYDEAVGSDNQYMSACAWNRSNKHRLLAVVIGQPVVPDKEIICFYDYDPQKHVLTPEPSILKGCEHRFPDSFVSYRLPRYGKTLLVAEQRGDEELCIHHYKWNGMQPVFDFSDPEVGAKTPMAFPGGLDDDGRGPDDEAHGPGELPYGSTVKYEGEDYMIVYTAEQFVRSLKSNARIMVARDVEINLTPYLNTQSCWRTQHRQWRPEGSTDVGSRETVISEAVFDGRQLTMVNLKQMIIRGEGNSRLVVEPRYAFCLNFKDCEQIYIHNLTIGHTEDGSCQGGVVGVQGGWRININDCDLYGCGTYGVQLQNTRDFSMYRSVIRNCTYGIMTLHGVESAKFERCDFFHNKEFSLVESRGSGLVFYDCRFYANHGDSKLFDIDQEFFLNKCAVYHPTENLGNIGQADKSGTTFSPNPFDSQIMPRDIGPDKKQ